MTDREFMKHGLTSSFYSMVGNLTFSRGGATKDEKNDCNDLLGGRSLDDVGLCRDDEGGWLG